jgi:hypothetical protein
MRVHGIHAVCGFVDCVRGSTRSWTDQEVAGHMASGGVDIMVDLMGLTRGARTNIVGLRPAPIAAAYLGEWLGGIVCTFCYLHGAGTHSGVRVLVLRLRSLIQSPCTFTTPTLCAHHRCVLGCVCLGTVRSVGLMGADGCHRMWGVCGEHYV